MMGKRPIAFAEWAARQNGQVVPTRYIISENGETRPLR